MKAVAVFLLVGVVICSAADYKEDKNVLVLGDADLADAIKEHDYLLVEFCKFSEISGWGNFTGVDIHHVSAYR